MTVDDLVNGIALDVPGCPPPFIATAVREAVQQLARDTRIYAAEVDRRTLAAETESFDVAPPRDARIFAMDTVALRIEGRGDALLRHVYDDGVVWLDEPLPRTGLVITTASLEPTGAFTTIPERLAEWPEPIRDYARYRLFLHPRQAWTDRAAAGDHRRLYDERRYEIAEHKARGRSRRSLRTAPPPLI